MASIGRDTLPKVMSICFPSISYDLNWSDGICLLPNGSEIAVAGAPEDWLGEGGDKMAQYKRLAGVTTDKELEILESEWRDRFGPPPTSGADRSGPCPEAKAVWSWLPVM